MEVVELAIALCDLPYPVTRRLRVPLALSLADLHLLVQAAMPWENGHLHEFTAKRDLRWSRPSRDDRVATRDAARTTLGEARAQMGRRRTLTCI